MLHVLKSTLIADDRQHVCGLAFSRGS